MGVFSLEDEKKYKLTFLLFNNALGSKLEFIEPDSVQLNGKSFHLILNVLDVKLTRDELTLMYNSMGMGLCDKEIGDEIKTCVINNGDYEVNGIRIKHDYVIVFDYINEKFKAYHEIRGERRD